MKRKEVKGVNKENIVFINFEDEKLDLKANDLDLIKRITRGFVTGFHIFSLIFRGDINRQSVDIGIK